MDSILTSVKKIIGLEEDYTAFDLDIIMHINAVFVALGQLGLNDNFAISDKTSLWSDYFGDRKNVESVKSYAALKVRLMFDPPTSTAHIEAINTTLQELEWRIKLQADKTL